MEFAFVMELGEGEQAVWSATLLNRWMLALGAALAVAGFAVGLLADWVLAIALLAASVVLLLFGAIRVSVDRGGLHVHYGVLGWPRSFVAIDRIEAATVVDVRPARWGGWGYRGSLKLARRAAVVVRRGPGLRLDLRGGRAFVVTIDEPETPAALLNAEVARLTAE